jgi:hypothetical protein
MISDRRATLVAAVGFLALEPSEPELQRLHRCFDNWRGVGEIVAGMARQEYDLELRRYDGRGWRAVFVPSGFEHSFTSHARPECRAPASPVWRRRARSAHHRCAAHCLVPSAACALSRLRRPVASENWSVAIFLRFTGLIRYSPVMIRWLGVVLGTLRSVARTRRGLALENLALRQQLAVWKALSFAKTSSRLSGRRPMLSRQAKERSETVDRRGGQQVRRATT